MRQRERAGES
jgi:hypothetical protein